MTILKELWTDDELTEDVRTTYGYVLDLKEQLEETMKLAHEKLAEAQEVQKHYFDKKTRDCQLRVGHKALILLPTTKNNWLMAWKGPFPVIGIKGSHDYVLNLGHTQKLLHINLLKRYEEQEDHEQIPTQTCAFFAIEKEKDGLLSIPSYRKTQSSKEAVINQHLPKKERKQLQILLQEYGDVFSDLPGKTNILECELQLTSNPPVQTPQYPIPLATRETIETEVEEMLRLGII